MAAFFIVGGLAVLLTVGELFKRYYPDPLPESEMVPEYAFDEDGGASDWWDRFKKKCLVSQICGST